MRRSVISYWLLVIGFLTMNYEPLTTNLFAYYEAPKIQMHRRMGPKTEVTDKSANFWWIHWTGIGNFGDITVSNTLQSGLFARPAGCDYFDGTYDCIYLSLEYWNSGMTGLTGEYPEGTNQFYVWGAGPWIGAKYPSRIDSITNDTTWQIRVSKGAYYSDMGGMHIPELEDIGEAGDVSGPGMTFSNQILPYDYGHEHEGSFIFKQSGQSQEDWQGVWPFADTLINKRRIKIDERTGDTIKICWVHPDSGDIISMEDSYACAGDWIPEKDASCIWVRATGSYDLWGLGIRVEQRTYSWNANYNDAYVYFNWKIRNMNNFPLKDVYLGYFMDNDVGSVGEEGGQGAWDDLIGYERSLNLGYTYDSDGVEPGWSTRAGFVGCVICESPVDTTITGGLMTGFQSWMHTGDFGMLIDSDGQDSLKYVALSTAREGIDTFMVWGTPTDVRQLSCSGPYSVLEPNQEIDFTVAIVVAYTLDELKDRARSAIEQFNSGYLGFSAPPSPALSVSPGDGKVYLSWDSSPESYICPMSEELVFEGYKVYKRMLPDKEWECLAVYDLEGSKTEDIVEVKYTQGTSKAEISFLGFADTTLVQELFDTRIYKITFLSSYNFSLFNTTDNEGYTYNDSAMQQGKGYCVMDYIGATPYSEDPGYLSGAVIYFDGIYVKIQDGEREGGQSGIEVSPQKDDEFTIWTYKSEEIGEQYGLRHYYIDDDVVNGDKYYYSVTSYSRPRPTIGIEELESGKSGTKYWAIPSKQAANWENPVVTIEKTGGLGTGEITAEIIDASKVIGHDYELSFMATDTSTFFYLPDTAYFVEFWRIIDKDSGNIIVLDSIPYFENPSAPLVDGVLISIKAPIKSFIEIADTSVDEVTGDTTYWIAIDTLWDMVGDTTKRKAIECLKVDGPNTNMWILPSIKGCKELLPYDYKIEFLSDSGCVDSTGYVCYFKFTNTTRNITPKFRFKDIDRNHQINIGDETLILYDDTGEKMLTFWPKYYVPDSLVAPPEPGDTYVFKTIKPLNTLDKYTIKTTPFAIAKDDYNLDSIRVVPNPYYIRAPWDRDKYGSKIWFQGLPSECTIRIFNVAGLLIKTIEHKETGVAPLEGPAGVKRTEYSNTGAKAWDLTTSENLDIVSGLYIYQVRTPEGKTKVGKFGIIR